MNKLLLSLSVKEAFDNLPSGVCFFNNNGIITLCNRRMYSLFFALTGKDLQSLPELQEVLDGNIDESLRDNDVYLPGDGSAWRFSKEQITARDASTYTQVTASDVTKLYRTQKELERDNKKLEEDGERIRILSSEIISLIREEEILNMKMRVHDDIGRSVIATRRFLQQGKPMEELDLSVWKNAVRLLKHDNEKSDGQDAVAELLNAAYGIGIKVIIDGEFPENAAAKEILITAARECMTNAVRHAGAKELYVSLSCNDGTASVSVTNDGALPDGEIVEGGGLASLRIRVRNSGGTMKVETSPRFELTVSVPVGSERTK